MGLDNLCRDDEAVVSAFEFITDLNISDRLL